MKPQQLLLQWAPALIWLRPVNLTLLGVQIVPAMASVLPVNNVTHREALPADGQKPASQAQQNIAVDATLAARQAQICSNDMAAVRARLTPEQSARCSDQTINQFLRATVSNIDQVPPLPFPRHESLASMDAHHANHTALLSRAQGCTS